MEENLQTMQEVYMGKLHGIARDICLVERPFSLKARQHIPPSELVLLVDMWMPRPKKKKKI
jgi:hypothetical protein